MRQNPPTCQKSREEVLMENSFRTTEHFDDRDEQMIIFQEHQHHTSHLPTKLLPWPQNWKMTTKVTKWLEIRVFYKKK